MPKVQRLLRISLASSALSALLPSLALALPQGGVVSGGVANIASPSASQLAITQASDRAVIDWSSFNIGAGERVDIRQPSAASVLLNRIGDAHPSQIHGQLSANGQVILSNPNGMLFGPSAQVDVGGLVATSTRFAETQGFLAGGALAGQPGQPGAAIFNQGSLTAAQGGLIALVAPGVQNDGLIVAKAGRVTLAGADTLSYDLYGDGLVSFAASGAQPAAYAGNTGTLKGAQVVLSAAQAAQVVDSAVNLSGVVDASSLESLGGTVRVTGDHIALSGRIDASGETGGGVVQVGGEWQGSGTTPWAQTISMDEWASIDASAKRRGSGGEAVLWSRDSTTVAGTIHAKGGAQGGDGGRIETSGLQVLNVAATAMADASAANGQAGLWLLDPTEITINAGAGADTASNVYANNIQATLNTGTNVTVQTTGANGDIVTSGSPVISKTAGGDATLTLRAHGSINLTNTSITSSSNRLNVSLESDSDEVGLGNVTVSGSTITTNNGNLWIGGNTIPGWRKAKGVSDANPNGINLISSTITTGNGNIEFASDAFDSSAVAAHGLYISATNISQTGGFYYSESYSNADFAESGAVRFVNGSSLTSGNSIEFFAENSGFANNTTAFLMDGNSSINGTGNGTVTIGGYGSYNGGDGYSNVVGTHIRGGSDVTTQNGSLTLEGYGGYAGTGATGLILADAGTTVITNSGTIALSISSGWGNGNSNPAFYMTGGAVIQSTGTGAAVGAIDIFAESDAVGSFNSAALISGAGTRITSVDGDIYLEGEGATNNGNSNYGIVVESGAAITSTGTGANAGNVTLVGTAYGSGGNFNLGTYLTGSGTLVSAVDGNIQINGTGSGTGTSNLGVYIADGAQIQSTGAGAGAGNITIIGTAGAGTQNNSGIGLIGNNCVGGVGCTEVGTIAGNITMTGVGAADQDNDGAGADTKTGTDLNHGIVTSDAARIITTGSGSISLTGTGGNGTINNQGVYLATGSSVSSTASGATAGTITLNGTGGVGTNTNYGVLVYNANTRVSSVDGDISITGQGRGSGGGNAGVIIGGNGGVFSTGTTADAATITVNGTGSLTGSFGNMGTWLISSTSAIASDRGAITVTGTGGAGAGGSNEGIYIQNADIDVTGSAPITLTGIAGATSGSDITTDTAISIIGGNSATGNITLNADTLFLSTLSIRTQNDIIVKPRTSTTSIGLGGAAGILNLNAGELSTFDADIDANGTGSLIIGDSIAGTGAVNINTLVATGRQDFEIHGGSVDFGGSVSWSQDNNFLINARNGNILLDQNLNKTAGGDSTVTLRATGNVNLFGSTISSATGAMNLILWSDADASGGGEIGLASSTITTNNGFFHAAGGADDGADITDSLAAVIVNGAAGDGRPDNYATGLIANRGITLDSISISTGTGTITMRGEGRSTAGNGRVGIAGDNLVTLQTTSGNIVLDGRGGQAGAVNNSYGLEMDGAGSAISTQTGSIFLRGRASGNGSGARGIWLTDTAVSSTAALAGSGNITLDGTASTAGTDSGEGVYLVDTTVSSSAGNILLRGTGGGTTTGNSGIELFNADISTTGTGVNAGDITLTGAATVGGTSNNEGIYLRGATSRLQVQDGDILLTGNGAGSANNNYGIFLEGGGDIRALGTGTLTLNGTGGSGVTDNVGILLSDAGTSIDAVTGLISLTGVGGADQDTDGAGPDTKTGDLQNYGITMRGGATIASTGVSAGTTISLSGTGGNGTYDNAGIYLVDVGTQISSVHGDIVLVGQGSGTDGGNMGIALDDSARIVSTGSTAGAARITLTGTSAAAGQDFLTGISLTDSAEIASEKGNIQLTGNGGAGTTDAHGISILRGSILRSTGVGADAATIGVTGTSGLGQSFNHGVYVGSPGADALITSVDGDITINGSGRGSNNSNMGVYIDQGSDITATGTADVTITGTSTGAGTQDFMHGFAIEHAGSTVTTNSGLLSITGTGGGSGGGGQQNMGIWVIGTAALTSQSGNITLDGTSGGSGAGSSLSHGVAVTSAGTVQSVNGGLTVSGRSLSPAANSYGILLSGSSSLLAAGAINLTGISDPLSSDIYTITGANRIGNAATTGTVTLNADRAELANLTVESQNDVHVRVRTPGTTIGLAGAAGDLSLVAAELAAFTADSDNDGLGKLIIGDATHTGNITLNAYAAWNSDVELRSNTGVIAFNGTQDFGSTNDVSILTNADVQINADIDNAQSLRLQATDGVTAIGLGGAAGTVNLTDAELDRLQATSLFFGSSALNNVVNLGAYANWGLRGATALQLETAAGGGVNVQGLQAATAGGVTQFDVYGPAGLNAGVDLSAGAGNGYIRFRNALTLTGDSLLRPVGTGDVSFDGTVNGAHDLTLTSGGSITFGAAVGGVTRLGDVVITTPDSLTVSSNVNVGSFSLTGAVPVDFSAGGGLNATGNISVVTDGAITGTYAGTGGILNAGTAAVNATVQFTALDINGASANLSAGWIGAPSAADQAMANLVTVGGVTGPGTATYQFAGFNIGSAVPPVGGGGSGSGGPTLPGVTPPSVINPPVPPLPTVVTPPSVLPAPANNLAVLPTTVLRATNLATNTYLIDSPILRLVNDSNVGYSLLVDGTNLDAQYYGLSRDERPSSFPLNNDLFHRSAE